MSYKLNLDTESNRYTHRDALTIAIMRFSLLQQPSKKIEIRTKLFKHWFIYVYSSSYFSCCFSARLLITLSKIHFMIMLPNRNESKTNGETFKMFFYSKRYQTNRIKWLWKSIGTIYWRENRVLNRLNLPSQFFHYCCCCSPWTL